MNMDIAKGKWNEIKGEAKKQWGELTDDEIKQADGDIDQLVGMVQTKYGKTKAEAEREVEDFVASL